MHECLKKKKNFIGHTKKKKKKNPTPASLVAYDGKFLTRGGTVENLEGDWKPKRLVILEFPSMEKAKAWWNSPEYTPAKLIRQRASNTQMIVADGI